LWFCARVCGGNVPGGGSWCSRGVYVGVVVACGLLLVCAVRLGFLFGVFLWFLLSLCFFPSRVFLCLFVTRIMNFSLHRVLTGLNMHAALGKGSDVDSSYDFLVPAQISTRYMFILCCSTYSYSRMHSFVSHSGCHAFL
jgi:hypothetical protein